MSYTVARVSRGFGRVQRDVLDFLRSRENAGLVPITLATAARQAFGREPTRGDLDSTRRAVVKLTADGLVTGFKGKGGWSGPQELVYRYIGPR